MERAACSTAQVSSFGRRYRRRHADHEGVGRFELCRRDQIAAFDGSGDQRRQSGFFEAGAAVAQHGHDVLVDIDTEHVEAGVRQQARRRQSDITQTQDANIGHNDSEYRGAIKRP